MRLKRLQKKLAAEKVDAFLVSKDINISYLTGFRGNDSWLLITKDEPFLITDFRYKEEAKRDAPQLELRIIDGLICEPIRKISKRMRIKRLGFESKHLSYALWEKLRDTIHGVELVPVKDMVESLREIKDSSEIDKIRKAVGIAGKAFEYLRGLIKPGISERALSIELDYFLKRSGARKSAYDIIVASGINSSLPHAAATNKKIMLHEPVLVDMGADYEGYNSDLTRVFFSGKIDATANKVYKIVFEAQRRALSKIKPGIKISSVDEAARGYIEKKGFGKFFGHGVGHGIGMEVHEKPHVYKRNDKVLVPGMVFTVEPAIYLPRWGGVRIEDMVLVTEKGCEVLTDDIYKST